MLSVFARSMLVRKSLWRAGLPACRGFGHWFLADLRDRRHYAAGHQSWDSVCRGHGNCRKPAQWVCAEVTGGCVSEVNDSWQQKAWSCMGKAWLSLNTAKTTPLKSKTASRWRRCACATVIWTCFQPEMLRTSVFRAKVTHSSAII